MFKKRKMSGLLSSGVTLLLIIAALPLFAINLSFKEAQADAVICSAATIAANKNGFCSDDTGTAGGIVRMEFTGKNFYTPIFNAGDINYIASEGLRATITRKHQTNPEDLIVMNSTAFNTLPVINRDPNDFWGGCQIAAASEGDADGKTFNIACTEPVNTVGNKIHFVFTDQTTFIEKFYTIDILSNDHSYSARKINGLDRKTGQTNILTISNNDKIHLNFASETPTGLSFDTKTTVSHPAGMELTKNSTSTEDFFNCSNGDLTKTSNSVIPTGVDDCGTSSTTGSEILDFCLDPKGLTGTFLFTFGVGLGGTESEYSTRIDVVAAGGGEVAAGCAGAAPNNAPVATAVNDAIPNANNDPKVITLTGTDADSEALTFAPSGLTGTGSLSGVSGVTHNGTTTTASITYTPAVNMAVGDSASFTYTVNDGTDTSTAVTVTITKASEGGGKRRRGKCIAVNLATTSGATHGSAGAASGIAAASSSSTSVEAASAAAATQNFTSDAQREVQDIMNDFKVSIEGENQQGTTEDKGRKEELDQLNAALRILKGK
jgi:hypothetical protein